MRFPAESVLVAAGILAAAGANAQTPLDPTTIYLEDFEGITTPNLPGELSDLGVTADAFWADTGFCNGILLDNATATSINAYTGSGGRCAATPINNLGLIAAALGGGDNTNVVASSYTQGGGGPFPRGTLQLQSPTLTLGSDRFYTASVDIGVQNCQAPADPMLSFILTNGTSNISLGPQLNGCAAQTSAIQVNEIESPLAVRWSLGTTGNLQLINSEVDGGGNDSAVDNLLLVDVTPDMYKSFDPASVVAGQPVDLTFTIVNRTDFLEKLDMGFTDTLASGLEVVPGTTPTNTCEVVPGSEIATTPPQNNDPAIVTASGSTISVSGVDLALGQSSCNITVQVRALSVGAFENGSDDLSGLSFINPPNTAALTATAPAAVDEALSINPGETAVFDVSANDTDFAGGDNSFTVEGGSAAGATIDPDTGVVTWDSDGFVAGDYTVEYEICNNDLNPVLCDTAVLTITVPPVPSLSINKIADVDKVVAGQPVIYTYIVTNDGNVVIEDATLTDVHGGAGTLGTIELQSFTNTSGVSTDIGDDEAVDVLGLNDTATFTATYVPVAADAGTTVSNTATANGSPVDGLLPPEADRQATETIDVVEPGLEIIKSITGFTDSNGSTTLDAGDVVTFEFTATNNGDVSLADISVTDTGLSPIALTPVGGVALAPGDGPTVVATATYVLTASDVSDGGIENTATGSAQMVETDGGGNPVPGSPLLDENGDALDPVTDTSDAGTEPTIDPATGLPGGVADPDGEETANADGSSSDSDPGNDPTALTLPQPEVVITKSVASIADTNGNGFTDAGDTVSYTFIVENTGNTDLTNVVVTDDLVGIMISGSPIASIPEDASDTSVTATYVLTTDDIAAGGVENSAEATGTAVDENGDAFGDPFNPGEPLMATDVSDAGTDPDGDPVTGNELVETEALDGSDDSDPTNDPTVFLIEPSPMIEVLKSIAAINDVNGNGLIDAGDTIDYAFTVSNTGNVALADVTVSDDLVTVDGNTIDLDIGETNSVDITATYEIMAADVTAGGVENTADVTGNAVDADGNEIIDSITGETLTAEDDSDSGSEPLLDATGNPIDESDPDGTESPGLDGSTDTDPTNDPTVLFIPNPELTVVKSMANVFNTNGSVDFDGNDIFGDAGDEITYSFTVTNTGNVDLAGIELTDDTATVSGGPIDLAVDAGDSITFTASYIITDDDVAAGFVENSAEATGDAVDANGDPIYGPGGDPLTATDTSDTGTDPEGDDVTDPAGTESDSGFVDATPTDGELGNDPTVTALPTSPNPSLSLIKSVASVADTSADGLIGEGDTVTYSFAVTNTGNVRLAGITVSDDLATVTGGPIDLAIGDTDSTTFMATSVITADQAAAGAIENTAEADGNAVNAAGDPIVDPTTNEPLTANDTSDSGTEPEIDDSGTPTSYADPEGNETPGADGSTDTDPTNDPTVLFLPMPELTIVKSVTGVADTNGNGFTDAGDTVSYIFDVTNSGNTVLAEVDVTDALPGIVITGSPIASILQGDTDSTVTADYVLTEDDIAANGVENTAEATGTAVDSNGDALGDPFNPGEPLQVSDDSDAGTDPDGETVSNPGATETEDLAGDTDTDPGNDPTVFTVEAAPALDLIKSIASINDLDGDGLPGVGDEVVYNFTVANVGNVDLADVTIADPIGTVTGGPIDLAIGASDSATFELVYELTATDVAAGAVENTASATGDAVDANGDPIADPITGGPLQTTDTSDTGTEPEIGAGGVPADVADPAGTESPDADGATDSDPTNDPTVLVLPMPELTVVKSVANVFDTNGDELFGGEGDEVTYQFTITNTGNVDLAGITLDDSIATVSGGPIDLAAGQGDSTSFTASYIITADDFAAGFIENTAEATGDAVNANGDPLLDLNGDPISVSDTSDTGTDPEQNDVTDPAGTESDPGFDGPTPPDSEPGNDPTVTLIPAGPKPDLSIVKSIASVVDDGDGMIGAGDTVIYSFTVTNTGNVALGDVSVTDPLVTVSGGPVDLAIGEVDSATFTAEYVLTADDVAAGGVENTATADGVGVNSLGDPLIDPTTGEPRTASDNSDSGTEPEIGETGAPTEISDPAATESPDLAGNTDTDPTNDPTVLFIPSPGISIVKSLASAPDSNGDGVFGGVGDELIYGFIVTNTGNTDLGDILVLDPTATVSGGPIDLAVGEVDTTSFTASYTVTFADINAGFVENTAEALGTALGSDGEPLGNPASPGDPINVSDTSDTGTDSTGGDLTDPEGTETTSGITGTTAADDDPTNDPTVVQIPLFPEPEVEIIKSVANVVDTDGDAVLGGEDDTVTYQFDVTNTGNTTLANVEVNDAKLGGLIGTIPTIAVGDTVTFTFDYIITEEDQANGFIENTATADGDAVNANGDPLLDPTTLEQLTASDDSDTGTDSNADPVDNPGLVETPDAAGGTDGDPTNDPTVLNVPLAVPDTGVSGIVFLDADEDGLFNNDDVLLAGYIVRIVDENGDIIASNVTDENGFYEMAGFPIGTHDIEFVDPVTGEVVGGIDGLVFGRNTVLSDQNQALDPAASTDQLILTKSTPLSTVVLGGTVPYQITVENASAFPVTADLIDRLPAGLLYLPDSGTIDGVAIEPTISGQNLIWSDVEIGVGETLTLGLIARVGPNTPVGDLTNTVQAFDEDGNALSTPATATVRRNPEAVFDCSDIIGKVFDDRNFDGYQNGPNNRAISDQSYSGGKGTTPTGPEYEPGLPNVRLVTPTGTIITTDEYGRYSVPCAELPGGMGTNFTLKLDTRSLPTGYRVTTENPRSMRVTAGIMTEVNFGAAIGRVIDIDLTAAAFDGDNDPVGRLDQGIVRVLQQVADEPSVLRISYFSAGEDRGDINQRLDKLEDLINARWRNIGDYRLIVERDVKYLQ